MKARVLLFGASLCISVALSGCMSGKAEHAVGSIPALTFADSTRTEAPPLYTQSYGKYVANREAGVRQQYATYTPGMARYTPVKDFPSDAVTGFGDDASYPSEAALPPSSSTGSPRGFQSYNPQNDVVTNEGGNQTYSFRPTNRLQRGYRGPLQLGDPGSHTSLWQESRKGNNLFSDYRARNPYDLITIIVDETEKAQRQANTDIREESTLEAGVSNFLGYENDVIAKNPGIDLANLLNAETTNDHRAQTRTQRQGTLQTSISAVILEVLPGGLMRVEGEKIVSVNGDEQIMIISGLVRQRDINSRNEVNSRNLAQLRIDFYGEGPLGDAQNGGWLGQTFRKIWPF